jgi:PAS domain S-box-containing protein
MKGKRKAAGRGTTGAERGATRARPRAGASSDPRRVEELERRLAEALEQQAATSEILRVISSSPAEVKPVFDTIVETAHRLCEADSAALFMYDGELVRIEALDNISAAQAGALRQAYPMPATPGHATGRAILTGRPAHIPDVRKDPDYVLGGLRDTVALRTLLSVPMIRDGVSIGAITVQRWGTPRPFSDRQVALLETFARQAVIAIENVRLFTETQAKNRALTESLEQQTATGEILRVISSSPTDVQPVFDTIAESAARLCDSLDASIYRLDGDRMPLAAHYGPIHVGQIGEFSLPFVRGVASGRAVLDRDVVHVADMQAEGDAFPESSENARQMGFRTILSVPLMREGDAIGTIALRRPDVRLFTDRQVALLRTFADQAVIAIENVRLFTELEARNRDLTETLEQQTATSEILRVISSSPTDIQPVLDAVAANAARLCEAVDAVVWQRDGQRARAVAFHGTLPMSRRELPVGRQSVGGRALVDRRPVHVSDLAADLEAEFPDSRGMKELGYRTILAMPLLREGEAIGFILIRRTEVRPFSDRQMALLKTFADQAVIAIENVRLFKELEVRNRDLTETLEQQTATGEILRVISSSPTDVQPVFDTIAQSARRLCGAEFCQVFRLEDGQLHNVANDGQNAEGLAAIRRSFPRPADRGTAAGRAIVEGAVAQIPDVLTEPDYAMAESAQAIGFRSLVAVPIVRDAVSIGSIALGRAQTGLFPERQVELLKTFAEQAVIAIENVRLFKELEARNRDLTGALERQTATAEILRAISGSPTDIQPVFDIIGERAEKLCDASISIVTRFDGEHLHLVSFNGVAPEGVKAVQDAFPMRLTDETVSARAVRTRAVVHVSDVLADPLYEQKGAARAGGYRGCLGVPMVRESQVIGAIFVARTEPGLFSDTQVELLKTFADQAVIAVQNVRLFQELDARNRDLTETLEQQTATGEILRVISSSPTNVQPVFDTLAQSAKRLCEAEYCFVFQFDGRLIHFAAHHGLSPEGVRAMAAVWPAEASRGTAAGRAILDGRIAQVADVHTEPGYVHGAVAEVANFRSVLAVPMLRDGVPIGVITVNRPVAGALPERQVDLLKTFADQAVIAVENVRLFKELEVRNRDLTVTLEQQTATGEILRVISGSPTDVQPVFDAVAKSAARLCEAYDSAIWRREGDRLLLVAHHGAIPLGVIGEFSLPLVRGTIASRSVLDAGTIHIADMQSESSQFPDSSENALRMGFRTILSVPLMREGVAIGAIQIRRTEVQLFTDRQVALLETFADQAVIAIENVRLFKELEVRNRDLTRSLEQQTATSEVLRIISGSPTDVQPVFDTIVRNAVALCDATFALVYQVNGELAELVAHHNFPPAALEKFRNTFSHRVADGGTIAAQAIQRRELIHVQDIEQQPNVSPPARELARSVGYRSVLAVPIMREGTALGAIAVTRSDDSGGPRPFSLEEIELLRTFTDQAVIAIENVRLFRELEARTEDLTRSVGELQALGEVSQAVSSTLDLEAVLATIVSRAVQLSGSYSGIVYEYDEGSETFHARATHQITSEYLEVLRASPIHLGEGAMGTAAVIQKPVQVADIQDERQLVAPQVRTNLIRLGLRSLLAMPLIRDGRLLGGLVILRREAGQFAPEVVATMQTFATQSVLAIQNARLFVEIQRQKQYSDVLVESSPVAIATMDLQGVVVGWNPGAERLFGYTQAEAVGRPMEDLVASPETREAVRENIEHTLAGQWIRDITRRVRKDGTLVDVEISSVPVIVSGERVGMLGIYHDITELLQARREAEAANEAKGAFLATMSHEIRTPMNAVIGMSGLLLNTALTDEQREYAEIVRQSGDTLLTVINDILDFSKIEAGRMELETQPFDLRECVEGALDLVATRAAEKGLDLAYLLGDGAPTALVGDVTRLRQVLLNLLSNAVKFTERGEIVVSVGARRAEGALHEVTFSVRDTGIGIPADRLGRLFQSFSQVDASTTRRYGGTGLGLAISQRLTELMGGRITVTSEVGAGSEFRFTIRAAAAADVPIPTRRDFTGVQPALDGKRVLVVDDNATNRRILASHLETWGVRARATESPREALGWVGGGERFDLGILDMHMPEMDGVALAQALRGQAAGATLPLILFTSLGRREARAEEAGFAAYLNKPIKPSQLFDALVSVLAEQPVHVPQRTQARSEIDPEMSRRHPLRILLAEDNVVNQKVATRLLGQMGYRPDIAANGLEAIAAVERQAYDVILMDVQMPELDGFEASREITRRWPRERRPRIVAMTANAMEGDRELCEAAGMDDYVAKPIRVEELVGALQRCKPRADVLPTGAPAAAPAAPAATAEAIDRVVIDRLGESLGREFTAELIDTFVADARDLVAALRRALAESDRDAFRRAAHTLKSTGESLGAFSLAALARELEGMGQAGRLHEVGNRVDRLADLHDRVAQALGAIRRDLTA